MWKSFLLHHPNAVAIFNSNLNLTFHNEKFTTLFGGNGLLTERLSQWVRNNKEDSPLKRQLKLHKYSLFGDL